MGLSFEHMSFSTVDVPEGLFRFWWDVQELAYTDHASVVHPDHYRRLETRPPSPLFSVTPDSSVEAEVARVVALGATVVLKYHNGWGCGWVDLVDPAGNLFTIQSAEPPDVDALLRTPRATDDPFWADAVQ